MSDDARPEQATPTFCVVPDCGLRATRVLPDADGVRWRPYCESCAGTVGTGEAVNPHSWRRVAECLEAEKVEARAERDAAISAGQKLADAVENWIAVTDEDPEFITTLSAGDSERAALTAWRALPGCCDRPVPETEA